MRSLTLIFVSETQRVQFHITHHLSDLIVSLNQLSNILMWSGFLDTIDSIVWYFQILDMMSYIQRQYNDITLYILFVVLELFISIESAIFLEIFIETKKT